MGAAYRSGANEGKGCVSFYDMYKGVAVVIYLVSFVPNLPLISRNPNITLMNRGGDERRQGWLRYRQKERDIKNIRDQSHSAF